MTDWRKPCEHGRFESHTWGRPKYEGSSTLPHVYNDESCRGGSPVTISDLIAELVRRGEWPHGIPATPVKEGK